MSQHPHPKDQKESRFRDYGLTIQWLLRECSHHLTGTQIQVALFIADRTLGWGKTSEVITHRHFLEGIRDQETGAWYAGIVAMTRKTLVAAISTLTKMGLVVVKKVRAFTSYSLNPIWSASLSTQPTTDMGLATPKRLQTLQTPENRPLPTSLTENGRDREWESLPPKVAIITTTGWESLPSKKSKEKKGKVKNAFPTEKREANSSPNEELEADSLDDLLSATSERSRIARGHRLSKWTTATAFAIWTDLEKKHHSGITHFTTTKANRHALTQYGKKWIAANKSTENWMIYLEWCIANWSLIRSEQLAWMRDAPVQPCMPFFVRNSDRFELAHEEKATFEAMSKMSLRDREVERRVIKGVPRDLAEKEVDERNGLSDERERLERAASAIKSSDMAEYGRQREAEATERRKQRWAEAKKLTTPAEKGTFDEWQ